MLGPLMVDIEGPRLTQKDRDMLSSEAVGGVILFSRHFEDIAQLQSLTKEIKALRSPALLIAVDQEGGRVQRFRGEFTPLPAMADIGQLYDKAPSEAKIFAYECGWIMAVELVACGLDISFAPVLDLNYGVSAVIGNRSFHQQPKVLSLLASAFIRGMNDAGMVATGKHFPGHGGVSIDSHVGLPIDERDKTILFQKDIYPFAQLIQENLLAGIMPAHVIYSALDKNPAGFSAYWLQEVLRKQLGFQGLIFSDDIIMEAASVAGTYFSRMEAALTAGCDMVLVCQKYQAVEEIISQYVNKKSLNNVAPKISPCYANVHYNWDDLRQTTQWRNIREKIISR